MSILETYFAEWKAGGSGPTRSRAPGAPSKPARLRTALLFALAAAGATDAVRAAQENASYVREAYPLPNDTRLEVSGLAALPDGRVALAIRKGEIWILENPGDPPPEARFRRFATGLHEPLGLTWHAGALYTTQRTEVTRVEDRDGDGEADTFVAASHGWGVSGNYHEYAYGPVFNREGALWIALNVRIGKGAELAGHRIDEGLWRGWVLTQAPGGELLPVAAGFRSPFGIGLNAEGDVFVTDQQGNWMGTCPLFHVRPGRFYGHADSLPDIRRPESPVRDPGVLPQGLTVVQAAAQVPGLTLPAVWFPYTKMGQSTTGIRADLTGGRFGPFAGQLFVGEFTLAQVNRVFLEKIDGEYQGACFPFMDGFQSAVLQMEFLPDGSMIVGESNRGWNSLGTRSYGLERVRWTGVVPFEILKMEAVPDGFRLTFTEPLADTTAIEPSQIRLESYTYMYQQTYGSPETDKRPVRIASIHISADRREIMLQCEGLRAGYVHELELPALPSGSGKSLRQRFAYYTLNRLHP